jgi:hypothetical protein
VGNLDSRQGTQKFPCALFVDLAFLGVASSVYALIFGRCDILAIFVEVLASNAGFIVIIPLWRFQQLYALGCATDQ